MMFLKKVAGFLLTVLIVVGCLIGLKAAPSLLWPERYKSLVQDEGYQAGHYTIGINERALEQDASTLLYSTLKKWGYERENPAPAPEEVLAHDGQFVKITGFMYPLESGARIRTFCLLRSTQTCCWGPKPQYNQYVLVEMEAPVPFERLKPVEIAGTFFVEPRPEDGYIYRMEGKRLRAPDA